MHFHKLEEHLVHILSPEGWAESRDDQVAVMEQLEFLRQAQKFAFGEVAEIPQSELTPSAYPRLPYGLVAAEFSAGSQTYVALAKELSEQQLRIGVWRLDQSDPPPYWTPLGFVSVNKHAGEISGMTLRNVERQLGVARADENAGLAMAVVYCLGRALKVLNCVNVTTEGIPAPEKLNKKRARSGKPPVYAYKVLVLKRSADRTVSVGGNHSSPRVHLRRGHMKRRKTGVFWWQPHAVGDRVRGVVMKDYRCDKLMAPAL